MSDVLSNIEWRVASLALIKTLPNHYHEEHYKWKKEKLSKIKLEQKRYKNKHRW